VVDPVKIAAFGTLISAVTLFLAIYFRWRDGQSRLKIAFYLGADPPRAWANEARLTRTSTPHPVAMFRVENVGARDEFLSDAYITLRDGREVHPFSAGNPPRPTPLRPGFPLLFYVESQGLSRELVNRGCKGTARVKLVIRLGRGKPHEKRIEIPDVEARAEGREPG
jgi:hypothetical protein